MIYYKAICNVARPGSDESAEKRSHSKITAAVRAATEDLRERCAGAFYLFAADWECDVAVLGILSRQAMDGEPFAREFFGELGTEAENIRIREVTFYDLDVSVQQNREKIVDDLIGSIILYGDGRLIITFNYRNEPVQTTLEEIIAAANHSSDIDCLASP